MTLLTVRERCLQAFKAALDTLGPAVRVERNYDMDFDVGDYPAVNMIDGGHVIDPEASNSAQDFWLLSVEVECFVVAGSYQDLGPAASDLQGRLTAAVTVDRTLGDVAFDLFLTGMSAPNTDRDRDQSPTAAFSLDFTVRFLTLSGDPYAPA